MCQSCLTGNRCSMFFIIISVLGTFIVMMLCGNAYNLKCKESKSMRGHFLDILDARLKRLRLIKISKYITDMSATICFYHYLIKNLYETRETCDS